MEGEKNIFKNDKLLDELFDYSNKEDEILYKNDIYPPLIEEENLQENSNKSKVEITRDKILQNLSLEEYSTFPQKNESFVLNLNDQGKEKEKEDQDKLNEEEIDYLQNIHKLNYLTFSPFGTSFFPNLSLNKKTEKEKEKKDEDIIKQKEKENKVLNIIDFDYNNYEINNDLLFNICMGFIDMNKLRLENVISNETILKKQKNKKLLLQHLSKDNYNDDIIQEKSDYESNKEISETEEIKKSLMKQINKFIEENKGKSYYKEIIREINKELNDIKKSEDVNKENDFLKKWKKKFESKKQNYRKYLKEEKQKKKKKEEEEKIKKKVKEIQEKERIEKIKKEEEIFRELEKIRMKRIKKTDKKKRFNKNILNIRNNDNNTFNKGETYRTRFLSSEPLRDNGFHTIRNKDVKNTRNKIGLTYKSNKSTENNDRYTYMKKNNYDYFFQDL